MAEHKVRVWDPLVRTFHWGLAGAFLLAWLSEDQWLRLHVAAGYTLLLLVLFRLVWGVIGPEHARFRDFVQGPRGVLSYLGAITRSTAPRHLGHNPAGGAMVLALLLAIAAIGASGLWLYGLHQCTGPLAGFCAPPDDPAAALWPTRIHGLLAWGGLGLVALHLLGVALASLQHRENLVRAMITGWKRAE